ncbi:hypothetical protein MKK75_00775 [Methylobacterium sp. J-030]|uniref:sugar-transfer associated ATP-grasp domain-containing protein n=1 Tax=Methylobacterium sp. J-030 TaxID=2836627 RepID=UPI001FBA28B0|nr:sugar-transfer associated ATP-grasp domain-containing protein [Methylobacterium sp. J-030]MCJ2067349.1 hypothetical protein [Methylobacterium sp. J-030]
MDAVFPYTSKAAFGSIAPGGLVADGQKSRPALDLDRPSAPALEARAFTEIVRASGLGPAALTLSFARLAFGPGSLSFSDFVGLRLYDPEFRTVGGLYRFVGRRRNRELCLTANYRHDWLGLMSDKVAALGYLAAHGLPTIPIRAIYAPQLSAGSERILADRRTLEAFLLDPGHYPLFGKPVAGFQSLGTIALGRCHPGARMLERHDGSLLALDDLVEAIDAGFRDGYLFQPFAAPDPAIAALSGPRLATIRLLTLASQGGPRLFRAAWKLPAGSNAADNYWRGGNLLGQIDLATGALGRVVSGTGPALHAHGHHPDTGASFAGVRHPHWAATCALALEGARLMRHVPLIGWDIACTSDGPVIVEMNETPDFFLVQLADRRGVLSPEFDAFLAEQRASAVAHRRNVRRTIETL